MRVRQGIDEQKVRRWSGANNLPGSRSPKPGWKHPVTYHRGVLMTAEQVQERFR